MRAPVARGRVLSGDESVLKRFLTAQYGLVVALVLAAVVLFQIVFGLPLLSASHPYWVEPRGDMASMMAGHYAIIDHPWNFPLAVTTALRGAATPTSIVYSDSLPWLTVILKALGIGRVVNVLALFMLISYVAQPLAMVALLRASGVTRISTQLLGGLIALFYPAWFVRQFGHIALAGHWLLILGLAWSVQVARFGLTRRRMIEIALLGLTVVGTHPYHLVPVSACLGAGLLSELLQGRDRAFRHAALTAAAYAACVGFGVWLVGYGGGGLSGGGGALGVYSMNVLAPGWPQASALFGQAWNGVWFTHTLDANGAQTFEGYNYLGAGVLLIALVGVGWSVVGLTRGERPDGGFWRRFGPLVAAMIGLTLYAIGPRPYFGPILMFDVGRPSGLFGDLIGLFRAHGRFFWLVGYAILAFAITRIDRLEAARLRIGLLILAAGLQVLDMTQMIKGVRTVYQPVAPFYDAVIRTDPAFEARPWRFQPLIECVSDVDAWTMIQLSQQALRRHGVSNSGPLARALKVSCDVEPAAMVDAAPNDRTITAVIGDRLKKPELFAKFDGRSDCYTFTRGLLCGRGLSHVPGIEPYIPITPQQLAAAPVISLEAVHPAELGDGWSSPEPHGTWTKARSAWLTIDGKGARAFVLMFNIVSIGPSADDSQRVEVAVDGRVIRSTRVHTGVFTVRIDGAKPGQPTRVELRLPDAAYPPAYKGKDDPRLLGIGVSQIRVIPLGR